MKRVVVLALAALVSGSVAGQVNSYGSPSPVPFSGTLDGGGQIPVVGNSHFKLVLHDPNAFGGGIVIGILPTSIPFGSATLLVDPSGSNIVTLSPGVTELPIPVPNIPALVGYAGYAQAGVFNGSLPGGFGLTNGIAVQVMPDRTPTRAYIPGQNFAGGPGLMTVLDLSVQPPVFRATGGVGFGGNISVNFPNKIVVADGQQVAYAQGISSTNQFVRGFNVAADPAGIVAHVPIGDIPMAGQATGTVAAVDMEVTSNGHYLFVTSAGNAGTSYLEVFDCSNAPGSVPAAPIQTITFPNAANGCIGLALSPADDRLAVVLSVDSLPALTIYDITPFVTPPLSVFATVPLTGAYPGYGTPSDVQWTPDGHQVFVSGADQANGYFSLIDVQTSPPNVLIPAHYWNPVAGYLFFHGSAIALMNGSPVALVGSDGSPPSYTLFDLNPTSPTLGMVLSTFTTNPGGNISNHRMHGLGSIVVAIEGSGALSDCEWVDVIDVSQPVFGGFAHWRVHMPTHSSLTPGLGSAIPRDFDMY